MAKREQRRSPRRGHPTPAAEQSGGLNPGLGREICSALATWYGLSPEQVQDTREPRPGARSVEEILPGVWERLGANDRVRQLALADAWPELVGAAIARHARPAGLHRGVLSVQVDHPAWSAELERFQRALLLERIAARFGQEWVRDIRCRVG